MSGGWEKQLNAICSHHQEGRKEKKKENLKTLVLLTIRPDVLFKYRYLTGAAIKKDSGLKRTVFLRENIQWL